VSEFYFTRFLYTCFGNIDDGLGTASVNIVIGLNLVSGLLGGFLADRVLGKSIIVR
jgi:dipeptide/tripeptide permease